MDRRYSLSFSDGIWSAIVERDDSLATFKTGDEIDALQALADFVAADIAEAYARRVGQTLTSRLEERNRRRK